MQRLERVKATIVYDVTQEEDQSGHSSGRVVVQLQETSDSHNLCELFSKHGLVCEVGENVPDTLHVLRSGGRISRDEVLAMLKADKDISLEKLRS